jgi:hypothetical protein
MSGPASARQLLAILKLSFAVLEVSPVAFAVMTTV